MLIKFSMIIRLTVIIFVYLVTSLNLFSKNRTINDPFTPYYLIQNYPQNLPQEFKNKIFDHIYWVNRWPDPINTKNGNLYLGYEDIYIPSSIPLTLYRSYNSHLSRTLGPFGYGWTFNYNMQIHETEYGAIEVMEGDGYANSFTKYGKTKSIRRSEAEFIVKKRIASDKGEGELRTKEYYKEMLSKLLSDDNYFTGLKKIYGRKKEKIREGTYYSLSRGNKKLEKRQNGYILYYPDGLSYFFNISGKLLSIINDRGFKIRFYYKEDRIQSIEDQYGRKLSLTYKRGTNLIAEVKDPIGRIMSFSYDDDDNLIYFKNSRGAKTSFEYGKNHKIVKIIFPDNGAVSIKYSPSSGRVEEETGPNGDVTKFIYGEDKLKSSRYFTKIVDANGNATTNNYYEDEHAFKQMLPGGASQMLVLSECCGMPTQMKDENGNMTYYAYDDEGRILQITDREGNITKFEYNENNNLTKIEDNHGISQYLYKDNRIVERRNVDGTTIKYEYNQKGNLSTLIDPKSNKKFFIYDDKDYLSSIVDGLGNKINFLHDSIGRVVRVIDHGGNEYKFEYDKNDNVVSLVDPLGRLTKYEYDLIDNITKVTNSAGNSIEYAYDLAGKLKTITDPYSSKGHFEYDLLGRIKSFTNSLNHRTEYNFDARGRILEIKDPEGSSYRYAYDANGNLTTYINPPGDTWHYKYDKLDRMVEKIAPSGNRESYKYDSNNNLLSFNSGTRNVRYDYSPSGRLVRTKYPDGSFESYKYDSNGNVARVTNQSGYYLLYNYDRINRLISINNPLNEIAKFVYDSNSNLISLNSYGKKFNFVYDKIDKPKEIIEQDNFKTSFDYDSGGSLARVKDANGNITTYKYDKLNRLTEIIDAAGNAERYEYNAIGNRVLYANPNGVIKKFSHDKLNRLNSVTVDNAYFKSFAYDRMGNVIEAKNGEAHLFYNYDSEGRIIRITDKKTEKEIIIKYSDSGKMKEVIYPDKSTILYSYDKLDRLNSITLPNKKEISISYKNNLQSSETYPNGVTVSYNYSTHEERQAISARSSKGEILNLEYFFDTRGNPTTVKDQQFKSEYKYDNFGRLVRENARGKKFAYKYDSSGNRTGIIKDRIKNFALFNSLNQIEKIGETLKYKYDKNGNLIEKIKGDNKTTYKYDADSNLILVSFNDKEVASFNYDAFGRRYVKKRDGTKSIYLYSILNLLMESGEKEITKFLYNQGFADPIGMVNSLDTNFFIKNLSGSIISMVDKNGRELSNYQYSAYGEILNHPKIFSPFMYSGKIFEEESELYYFLNRYYDPESGTYMTKDPIDINGGINLYNYANNNPMRFTDPLGLFSCENVTIPTRGDRLTLGLPKLAMIPESFPMAPSFPIPGELNGYGATYGRTPTGAAIFANLNHPVTPGNTNGGGGKYGASRINNAGVLGKLLLASYVGDIYLDRSQIHDPLSLFKSSSFQSTQKVTISRIYESMVRAPFTYASTVGKWLFSGRDNPFYFLFPKRDDPFFTTPRIGTIDFLNLPRKSSLFGTNPFFGAERGLSIGLGSDYVKNSIMQSFKRSDIQHGKNSYDAEQASNASQAEKIEKSESKEEKPKEKNAEPIANMNCQ